MGFRDWYVAESILLSILEETSCLRGRWDGMGKAILAVATVRGGGGEDVESHRSRCLHVSRVVAASLGRMPAR